jgi:hypothetical protein
MSGPLVLEPTPPSEQEEEPLLSVEEEDAALLEDAGILADVRAVLKTSWLPALFVGLLSGLVATMVLVRDTESKCTCPGMHGPTEVTPSLSVQEDTAR